MEPAQPEKGSGTMEFRKKPVVIEAVQWTGLNIADIAHFMGCEYPRLRRADRADDKLEISTLEGTMTADSGDWIIKGVKGEFYPCKPDIFEQTYERVEE